MEGTSLVSVSQYDGGRRRVMDDGTYDIDIEVGPGRCGMSTLVLFLPHTTRPPQQSHPQVTTTTQRTMTSTRPSNLTLTQESGVCR